MTTKTRTHRYPRWSHLNLTVLVWVRIFSDFKIWVTRRNTRI